MIARRQFLGWLAGIVPIASVVRLADEMSVAELHAAPETLDALAVAILPSELGEAQALRIVASFRNWMQEYREKAELLHAYGASRLTFAGPTPATRWLTQLDQLEASAHMRYNKAFTALSLLERRIIARDAVRNDSGAALPSPERANHIATALLSFFFGSPAATDLCYEVAIGRNSCRPLADSPLRPRARRSGSGDRTLPVLGGLEGGS